MFERFTHKARQVVVEAQEEARSLKHNYIGTEHLLLGLLRIEDGVAAKVLGSLDVAIDGVREQVACIVGTGEEATSGQIPFTPRAKTVLELALREALSLGHNYIGTEHLLLGLVREKKGVAARILADLGLEPQRVHEEVVGMLGIETPVETESRRFGRRRTPTPGLTMGRPACWEYRVERRADLSEEWLNELGAEGWQLAGVVGEAEGVALVFQRLRQLPGRLRAAG